MKITPLTKEKDLKLFADKWLANGGLEPMGMKPLRQSKVKVLVDSKGRMLAG